MAFNVHFLVISKSGGKRDLAAGQKFTVPWHKVSGIGLYLTCPPFLLLILEECLFKGSRLIIDQVLWFLDFS